MFLVMYCYYRLYRNVAERSAIEPLADTIRREDRRLDAAASYSSNL